MHLTLSPAGDPFLPRSFSGNAFTRNQGLGTYCLPFASGNQPFNRKVHFQKLSGHLSTLTLSGGEPSAFVPGLCVLVSKSRLPKIKRIEDRALKPSFLWFLSQRCRSRRPDGSLLQLSVALFSLRSSQQETALPPFLAVALMIPKVLIEIRQAV